MSESAKPEGFIRKRTRQEHQDALDTLTRLFDEIDVWHERVQVTLQVEPHSHADIANRLSEPFQASHAANYLLLTAVDHLHAVRTLMRQAQAQHIFAPYSLIRAALETASAGLWILAHDSPRVTAIRALKLESLNLAEVSKAYETVQGTDAGTTQRRAILEDAIIRNGFQRENIKGRAPGSLKIIQAACTAFDAGIAPVLMWQMCSAATHGRNWISGFLTMMDAQDDLQSKVITGRLTSDEQSIVLAMYAACDLVRRLFKVQTRRYTKHAHTGESFMTPQLVLPHTGLLLPFRRL